ncbi:MAG: S8 family serine peptidase [Saprospiraceae bacterium]|nr:S8 family serine peptidase [Saprospiraceae bacterium]
MQEAIQYAKSRGVPVVASAGNFMSRESFASRVPAEIVNVINWDQNRQTVEDWHVVPAVLQDVICVGAANVNAPYGNTQTFGSRVDVWGPEDGYYLAPTITDAEPAGGYTQELHQGFNGTSSSAPFITGLIANAMAVNPLLNPRNTALTVAQRSQIPVLMRNLLVETALQSNALPIDPTGRRRNLVNPLAFIIAANDYQNAGIPRFSRYAPTYNLSYGEENFDVPSSARQIDGSLYAQSVIPGAIVYIPSRGNNTPAIVDRDYFRIFAPSQPGQYTTDIVLTTPRGDRYGNLVLRGTGLQLISTALVGNNEQAKTYRTRNISIGNTLTFSVEGENPADDNVYELVVKAMTSPSFSTEICRGNTTRMEEGIYSIRLNANNKALDASDHANVQLWDYHGGNNQLWYIKAFFENGRWVHRITNLAFGNNLSDNSIDGCDGVDNGERVQIFPTECKWLIESAAGNTYMIRSLCGTYNTSLPLYQLLEGNQANYQQNGGHVVFQQCNGNSTTNRWSIRRIRNVNVQNVLPAAITGLCPSNKIAGDHEFGGNGPRLSGSINISISPDGNNLLARIDFIARETGGDWSEVRGSWTRTIYTAPPGMRILNINSTPSVNINHLLIGGGRDEFWQGCDGDEHAFVPGGPIARMVVVGDTGGADISGDADCNCDTRINRIEFNSISVSLTNR